MAPKRRVGRKLLVASIGVATMTYVGVNCGGSTTNDGTDQADATPDTSADAVDDFPVANLVAPPLDGANDAQADAPEDAPADAIDDFPVANLVPPPDAGMK
jgi:hypothetical protein